MSDEPLDQSDIEALMAAQFEAAAAAPAAPPASAADGGGSLSQAEIEAILAGEQVAQPVLEAPAAVPVTDGGGSLSQAEIEAILAGGPVELPPAGSESAAAAASIPAAAGVTQPPPVTMPAEQPPVIEDVAFDTLYEIEAPVDRPAGIDVLMDVPLSITVELGQATVTIRDLLALGQGSILRLNRHAGEPVDVLVNGRRLARGEVVVMEEDFGIRVTDVVSAAERLRSMGE